MKDKNSRSKSDWYLKVTPLFSLIYSKHCECWDDDDFMKNSLLDLLLASEVEDVVVRDNLLSQLQGTVASVMEELLTWFYFSVRGYTIQKV